ncbi:hypothetical protein H4582DRAFT_1805463 [Lactarius indigo]|nr:hypothetical protein H4582DRAFT_1805463 [Lactarius indigo]
MHLMYTVDSQGNRVYTLKVSVLLRFDYLLFIARAIRNSPDLGKITKSAHPARFSPDDKFSRHRVTIKKRHGVLLTQLPAKPM